MGDAAAGSAEPWTEDGEVRADASKVMDDDLTDNLLSALKSRFRRRVLRSLIEAESPMSPTELASYHRVGVGRMSHHIKTLLAVDGVQLVGTKPSGGSVQHFYEPGPACLRPLVREAIGVGAASWSIRSADG